MTAPDVHPTAAPASPGDDSAGRSATGGDGPADDSRPAHRPYHHPAAGWGAAKSVSQVPIRERALVDGLKPDICENMTGSDFALEDQGRHLDNDRYRGIAPGSLDMPRGSAAGYMPEMNVLVAASDYSTQSNQPLTKNIKVRVTPHTEDPS
ncbi:hypothetical protein [Streptomyces sp. Act143]|uniref:hypothetical protein n=1 Tax=Streptomyces sp. Act143 TaxID=2200760 RepID=UPI0026C6AA43